MYKTFSIKTLGCKLNQYESALIAGQFRNNGWVAKPFGETVDIVIVNTCTVTNKSDKKCRNYIRQGGKFSKTGSVLVTGCLAERDGKSIDQIPGVFAVAGNSAKENIFSIVMNHLNYNEDSENIAGKNNILDVKKEAFPVPYFRTRGLIKIQDGCDGKCSYCIVPDVRGVPVSRDYNDIIDHAKMLISAGAPELILTGITIGKYDSKEKTLACLVSDLSKIDGDFRIRISSIEPKHITDEMVDILNSEKVCAHLHIPLQSGSDKILKLMNRPYSVSEYMHLIQKIRRKNDKIALGTDIIIGFPGETDIDFKMSLKLIEESGFSYVHQFSFSPRSGTPASAMKSCNSQEILERGSIMRDVAKQTGFKYRRKFLGRDLPSIIEKNKKNKSFTAVSDNYIKIRIIDDIDNSLPGRIIRIRLDSVEIEENTGSVLLH